MSARAVFALVGVLALGAGGALWWLARPQGPGLAPAIAPTALYAASFMDLKGAPQALGQFQGKWVVLNFWATWCAPCREEMPAFDRVQARWPDRVQVVGVSDESREQVARFASQLPVRYPLWIGPGAGELSLRLGNQRSVLPFTAILDPAGNVAETRVGPYTETELIDSLRRLSGIR